MSDLIDRQTAINALHDEIVRRRISEDTNDDGALDEFDTEAILRRLPSAQPDYQEVLSWLLAYHTKSFYLHGRYLPHEVISWLINDFTKEFIAERRTDG